MICKRRKKKQKKVVKKIRYNLTLISKSYMLSFSRSREGSESLAQIFIYVSSINPKFTVVSSTISFECVKLQLIERRQLVVFVRQECKGLNNEGVYVHVHNDRARGCASSTLLNSLTPRPAKRNITRSVARFLERINRQLNNLSKRYISVHCFSYYSMIFFFFLEFSSWIKY